MNAPRDLGGLSLELDAAMHGESIAAAAMRRCRAAMDRGQTAKGSPPMAAQAWRAMSVHMREILVSMATDRKDPQRDACQAWGSFTDAERAALGATAREWHRQTQGAQWLR